jgi:hypothetical protein
MTKRDLYFALNCEMLGIGRPNEKSGEPDSFAVGRVSVVNWENQVVLDTCVQIPVPVTDFRTEITGIVQADVTSPVAMSFAQVRAEVERILRGKILIGHDLNTSLHALGLTHPWCDVRDSSTFSRFQKAYVVSGQSSLQAQSLNELALQILKRKLVEPTVKNRPVELCIAALDLYKTFRKEWEDDLVHAAQQKDARLETHQHERSQHQRSAYPPSTPPQPLLQPHHPQQQRPRLPSFEALPPERMHVNSYQPHHHQHGMPPLMPPQPQVVAPPHDIEANEALQSSWLRWGKKSRLQHPMPQQNMTAPALSAHAMQVLSAHDVPSDQEMTLPVGSLYSQSYYDGSTQYEASTDYESSHYEGSVMSESVASESVASRHEEPMHQEKSSWLRFGARRSKYPAQQQQRTADQLSSLRELEEPQYGSNEIFAGEGPSMHEEGASFYESPRYYATQQGYGKSSSSWFAFRRTKYPGPKGGVEALLSKKEYREEQEPPTEASESCELESLEPTQGSLHEGVHDAFVSNNRDYVVAEAESPYAYSAYHAPKTVGLEQTEKPSWFGFRRSKSPKLTAAIGGTNDASTLQTEVADGLDKRWSQGVLLPHLLERPDPCFSTPPQQNSDDGSSEDPHEDRHYGTETTVSDSPNSFFSYDAPRTDEQERLEKPSASSSSWFGFRLAKSSKLRFSAEQTLSEMPVRTESTEPNDDDWLEEVLQSPSMGSSQMMDEEEALKSLDAVHETTDSEIAGSKTMRDDQASTPTQASQPNPSWFRFSRGPRSLDQREVSRLPGANPAAGGRNLDGSHVEGRPNTMNTSSGSNYYWLEDMVPSPLVDSACLGAEWFGLRQIRQAEEPPESRPIMQSDHETGNMAEEFDFYLRSRLCTESTLATVQSDGTEEDDLIQDLQGMEMNLSFLNI